MDNQDANKGPMMFQHGKLVPYEPPDDAEARGLVPVIDNRGVVICHVITKESHAPRSFMKRLYDSANRIIDRVFRNPII